MPFRRRPDEAALRAGIHFRRRLAPGGRAVQNRNMIDDLDGDGLDTTDARRRVDDAVAAPARSTTTSPELAWSLRETENMWRQMDAEFGLLTVQEVAELLGPPTTRAWVAEHRKAGHIIGVRRGNSYRYPAFQFDRDRQIVLPLFASLLKLARANDWCTESLSLWMLGPSTSFAKEDRPVDNLQDPQAVLAAAKMEMEAEW